jgi:hypothetical protein
MLCFECLICFVQLFCCLSEFLLLNGSFLRIRCEYVVFIQCLICFVQFVLNFKRIVKYFVSISNLLLLGPVGGLVLVHSSPVALAPKHMMLMPECKHVLQWGEQDQCLRLSLLHSGKVVSELEHTRDVMMCGHTPSGGRYVCLAGQDRAV